MVYTGDTSYTAFWRNYILGFGLFWGKGGLEGFTPRPGIFPWLE